MSKELCADCGAVYEGGPHTFLCPKCKRRHQEKGWAKGAETRARKRAMGQENKCVTCGEKKVLVAKGFHDWQWICPVCQKEILERSGI